MTSDRMRRVDEAVRGVLSDAVRQLKDPRIGFVTVTDVDTSPDLSHATVYVSVLGTEVERKGTLAGLRSAHGVLQRRVAKDLRMKRTPQLTFAYDDTHEKALELGQLIDREVGGRE
jgi:ribosome-binding factor A